MLLSLNHGGTNSMHEHDYFYVSGRYSGYYECLTCHHQPSLDEYAKWARNG